MADNVQLMFQHRFTPELRERLDAYLEVENERIAPAELSMRSVLNEAIREWLDKRAPEYARQSTEVIAVAV